MSEGISGAASKNGSIIWAARSDADQVASDLGAIIAAKGPCRLAVPGGETPLPIFDRLAHSSLPWGTVTMMLTDDRIVAEDHPASNQGKLDATLGATAAQIISLKRGMTVAAFDLVWLGMGADGHIASIFPNMLAANDGGSSAARVIKTVPDPLPPEAPFERLSLNMAALLNTKQIMLVVRGEEKKRVLDAAIAGDTSLPIGRLIEAAECPLTIYWSRS